MGSMSNEELLSDWAAVREGLKQALELLADEQLRFTPREGLRTVGEIAYHIAGTEENWLRLLIYGKTPATWTPEVPANLTAAEVRAALSEAHDRTEAQLASADLRQEVTLPWGSRTTLRWAVWHVLEHEIHHRGEIYLMLGLLGIEAPDV